MQPSKLATNTRNPIRGEAAQNAIRDGVDLAYEVAKAAFGPSSGDVAIEAQYGDPIVSHDGVFNLDHLHVPDPGVNMAMRILIQASRATNVHVGDGTTLSAMLAASIYTEARELFAQTSEPRMRIAQRIRESGAAVVERIEELKIKATPELLANVAVISAGDEAIGALVSDTIQTIGADGGVIIEDFRGAGIYNDIVEGFYFRRGFTDAVLLSDPSNLESRFDEVLVLVCEKELSKIDDIGPLLDKCMTKGYRQLVLVGNVTGEALALAVKLRIENLQSNGSAGLLCTIVDSPEYGSLRSLFMDDLALYVGGKVFGAGQNANEFDPDVYLGQAKVVINEFSSTFIDGLRVVPRERMLTKKRQVKDSEGTIHNEIYHEQEAYTDDSAEQTMKTRIEELTEELRVASSPIEQEAVRGRLGRLSGKIAILRVGGNTEVEQQNAKLHVEDAVAALQAAIKDGVVPGGGVTIARVSKGIAFHKAFRQPFIALMENAGYNSDYCLWNVQKAKDWQGYDLRNTELDDEENPKLVNLKTSGVVDPTLVLKEAVGNACSVAAQLIKMNVLLPFDNREAKRG